MEKKTVFITIFLLSFALAGGGNPEVKVINQCFKLKGEAKTRCLDMFFPGDTNVTIYPPNSKKIKLAGRKSSIERGTFNLKNQNKFIISVELPNSEFQISCNIKTAKIESKGTNQVIIIPVKDIDDKVTLRDRNGRILLEYTIVQ